MSIPLIPLVDGTPADAKPVMENFERVVAAVEGVTASAAGTDVYQPGVVESSDWVPGAGSINSGTGVLQFTAFGGAAWLPGPVSGLVRTFTASSTVAGLKPPVLPGPAGYLCVGVELTASGAAAVVNVVSGAEQVSEAAAIAAPPAVSSGKMRVRNVIVLNTGGVYSIAKEIDRRPWALGHILGAPPYISRTTNWGIQVGESALVFGAITGTLPAAAAGATCSFWAATGASPTIAVGAGAKIYGDFVEGVASIKLAQFQHLEMACDGTNWLIVAGEPKREQNASIQTAVTSATPQTPSTSRPAIVFATAEGETAGIFKILVNGRQIFAFQSNPGGTPVTFWVPPGMSWEWKQAGSVSASLQAGTVLL